MIYSYAAPMPMKLRPPLQNSEKLLIFGANLDEFLLTANKYQFNEVRRHIRLRRKTVTLTEKKIDEVEKSKK